MEFWLPIRHRPRLIAQPEHSLDLVQRAISDLLFPIDRETGPAVNGYVATKSVKTNAERHIGARYVQKFDLADFFGSVSAEQISAALAQAGFGTDAAQLLSRLVSNQGALPLGARTSPRVSNLVLRAFDLEMLAIAEVHQLVYSRYADDLTFSSVAQFDVKQEVRDVVTAAGYTLNAAKTKTFKYGQPMFVTGLSVSNDTHPRLRRSFKKRLRQQFYYIDRFGIAGHAEAASVGARFSKTRLMGQFHYARSIEPDFATALQLAYPRAYTAIIPPPRTDRFESVLRHRAEFLAEVMAASSVHLDWYTPTVELG